MGGPAVGGQPRFRSETPVPAANMRGCLPEAMARATVRRVAVTDSHALGAADGAASSCFSGAATRAGSIVLGGICQDGQLVFDVHDWDP